MNILKLTEEHKAGVRSLFDKKDFMGIDVTNWDATHEQFAQVSYNRFVNTYLSDLKNFHSYGAVADDGTVHSLIGFYESVDEPSWFYTLGRSNGNNKLLKSVLDSIIEVEEAQGRLKLYSLVNLQHASMLRRLYWSKYNSDRYHYVDEYMVPAKYKTYYNRDWELLFKRMLLPTDTVVRCSFLKQEFRTVLPIGGNI